MERKALAELNRWWKSEPGSRKPLIIRGARQVGKSFLVKDFCRRQDLQCLEINFEREPSIRKLFVEGHNSKTIQLLEAHFNQLLTAPSGQKTVLFLDEIQATPEVFARLRYFYEDTPEIAVIAAGSLLEFVLADFQYSVPVGRVEYLYLGPMGFEEYLHAMGEAKLLQWIREWQPSGASHLSEVHEVSEVYHSKLLSHVRDFSLIGGMPEVVQKFISKREFVTPAALQRSLLDSYRNDFAKFRKRIPLERLDRVFNAIPSRVGKKWVHARVSEHEKAHAIESALELLCMARIAYRVFHSSGNGVPLAAEQKDNLYKVLFLDVGLMGAQLGLKITDILDPDEFSRVNEGSIAEQWIGQHLLDLREFSRSPEIHYWVREKAGSMAEVDYLYQLGNQIIPIEVKAGSSLIRKSLQVFLAEKINDKSRSGKKTPLGVHFSTHLPRLDLKRRMLELPFYLVQQLPRLIDSCSRL